ncbi:MAG: Lrp/AsnC family transcriptional regulator, partial [Asgard group archaeon]|nr:Lrp/AsnC family transcriptional regulator [Asgard group archaeon]
SIYLQIVNLNNTMKAKNDMWIIKHMLNNGIINEIESIILKELIVNSRSSVSLIANESNVSRPTVYERIKSLENRNIIDKYTTEINYNNSGLPLTAFIQVAFNPGEAADQKTVAIEISKLEYVNKVHIITGNYDFLVEIAIDHMSNLADTIIDNLRSIKGVGNTVSNVSFKSYKDGIEINSK